MTDPVTTNGTRAATTGWPAELNEEYEFLGELGRGGMAVVFRARERALNREVAVKVVRPRFHSDEESVARLAREARTVAQLEHPNIVSLHAIKRLNSGLALVMQIVPGRTLKSALATGPLSVERTDQVLRDITRALAYAHRCGVVHRDVKPENIFLDDVTGRALLSDFGVARSITENSELTATGTAIGTPTYMSPEQIDGGALDGRSDLYALGMVAWEMLTGQRPWFGESLYSVIYRQKHDALPPLDVVRSDVPPRLQYLIEGLMQKRPDDRWPGAARFLTMLTGTDKLPGMKEWQVAAKKRRKTGAYRAVAPVVEPRSISPASSTVQFRRGETPAGTIPSSANEQSITPSGSGGAGVRINNSPWGATTAIPTAPRPRRTRWPAVLLSAGVIAASLVALFILLDRPAAPAAAAADEPTLRDQPGFEVPVIPAADSNSVVATGTVDSASIPPAATSDSARNVATNAAPAPRDSGRPVPTNAQQPVQAPQTVTNPPAAPRNDTATAPEGPPSVTFAAERGNIGAGQQHSCILSAEGRASCWGSNENGQLGDGTNESQNTPVAVAGDFVFSSLSSGGAHTCGVSRGGEILCWGSNGFGQLGDGTSISRQAPVRVGGGYRTVRSGGSHTCAITGTRSVQCWGRNSNGQLGDGTRNSAASPVTVAVGGPVGAVAAGSNHTCAITTDGQARCWGRNDAGQLGDGSTTDHALPTPVAGDRRFISISAGTAHTCAVATDGSAWCWGRNTYGQLGLGTTTDANTPQQTQSQVDFLTVTLGTAHSCGRGRDGRAWCWGRNTYGQLGDGSSADRTRPTAVRGGLSFQTLTASGSHTCGATGAEGFCWGYNVNGQLGVGDRESVNAPTRIATSPR